MVETRQAAAPAQDRPDVPAAGGASGVLLALHAASCGLFFCIRIPGVGDFSRDIYDDVRDLYVLAGEHCVCSVA